MMELPPTQDDGGLTFTNIQRTKDGGHVDFWMLICLFDDWDLVGDDDGLSH